MQNSDWSESLVLADWADMECRHLDLIHSWEILLSVYAALGFTDEITDAQRLLEFKAIIGETNKFLTRMRKGLMGAKDIESAIEFLGSHVNTADMGGVTNRQSVAYNKLKQRWIGQAISTLDNARPQPQHGEGERDDER